jgi:uncharacterized membrane protein
MRELVFARRSAVLGLTFALLGLGTVAAAEEEVSRAVALELLSGDAGGTAFEVNDFGVVVGSTNPAGGGAHAVRWSPDGKVEALGVIAGNRYSEATGINNQGEMVGYSYSGPYRAVRWDARGHVQPLEMLPGFGYSSLVAGIDELGNAAGTVGDGGGQQRAVRWDRAGHVTELPGLPEGDRDTRVTAVGPNGDVAGSIGYSHAVKWDRHGVLTDLGAQASTTTSGINVRGETVGHATGLPDQPGVTTVRWDAQGHQTVLKADGTDANYSVAINNLGSVIANQSVFPNVGRILRWDRSGQLTILTGPATEPSVRADALNDRNEVAGTTDATTTYRAVRWDRAGTVSELDLLPGTVKSRVYAMNNRGDVVGYSSTADESYRPVLWRR